MQKKIIALAVAGLVSGVAFAQTNVTVYGVVDVGYVYNKSDDAKFSGLNDGGINGSRIGFKGEEALGNGLSAIFTLEYGTNAEQFVSTSTTAAGGVLTNVRQSFVGLKSNWGSLTLGRQYAPAYSYLGGTSSNEVTTVHVSNALVGNFNSIQTGSGARWNNSVSYNTPVVSGFQGRAIYSFGEKVSTGTTPATTFDTTDAGRFGLGGTYTNGPIYLTAVYQATAKTDNVAADDGIKAWTIGGAYDFKVVKLFANYIKEKNEVAADFTKKYWSLGASAPIGKAGSFIFEYASYKQDDVDNNKTKGYSFGYNHNLSKRTAIYSAVSRISNDKAAKNGFNSVSFNNDDDSTNFAVGVRHFF